MDFTEEKFMDAQSEEMNTIEAAGTLSATGAEDEEWDFWDSEYWIVRDRPPYRV